MGVDAHSQRGMRSLQIEYFSAPWDLEAVDMLDPYVALFRRLWVGRHHLAGDAAQGGRKAEACAAGYRGFGH